MAEANISFSGGVPENYDKFLGPFIFEPYAQDMVSRIKNTNISSVLEIAAGTGRVTKLLRKLLPPPVKITATDLQEGMLEVAKKLVNDDTVYFEVADANSLQFPDNSFDLVVCQFGIMFFPDKQKALDEMYRVLKPGGTLIFNTWDKMENLAFAQASNEGLTRFFGGVPCEFLKIPFSMHNPEELEKMVSDAKFKNVSVTRVEKEGISSAEDAASGMIKGSPASKEISEKGPDAINKALKITIDELRKKFGDGQVKTKLIAWVTQANK